MVGIGSCNYVKLLENAAELVKNCNIAVAIAVANCNKFKTMLGTLDEWRLVSLWEGFWLKGATGG